MARASEAAGLTHCPHVLGGTVGPVASAPLFAAVGGEGLLEVDSSENPLLKIFPGRGLALEDGRFPLSREPGLGFEPDIAAARDLLTSRSEVRL